jgi:Secretion system C-terminal sorting domain
MKKLFFIAILSSCLIDSIAQQFNIVAFPGNYPITYGAWCESLFNLKDDTIMLCTENFGTNTNPIYSSVALQTLKGTSFISLKEFKIQNQNIGYSRSKVVKINDTNYLNICQVFWYINNNPDSFKGYTKLIWVNPERNFDTIRTRDYYLNYDRISTIYNACVLNNRIYTIGRYSVNNTFAGENVFAACLNMEGDIIWQRDFGIANKSDVGWDITSDGKSKLLLGTNLNLTFLNGAVIKNDNVIFILDTLGNEILQKKMWKNTYTYIANIDPSNDGNYYFGGSQDTILEADDYSDRNSTIAKIDSNANIIWQRYFNDIPNRLKLMYNFDVLPNADVMITGSVNDNDGWICLLDKNGNVKWQHTYKSYDASTFNVLDCSLQASNGDFIFAGSANDSITNKQGSWIIRTDSNGCLVPSNCAPLSTQQIELDIDFDIIAYPNPTNAILQIKSSNGRSLHGALELYNNMGQQVFKTTLLYKTNTIQMSSFALGNYTIRYFDSEVKKWFVKRVIKN